MKAGLGDDVNLNGGVTARVVDGAGVDLGDRHDDELRDGSVDWGGEKEREEKQEDGRRYIYRARERREKIQMTRCWEETSSGGW